MPPYEQLIARTERARALLVPVSEPTPGEYPGNSSAGPVLPGRAPQQRPRRVRQLTSEQEPLDGVACPWCGTVNPESRHFCRRCATLLSVSAEPKALPWWRRMFRRDGKPVPMAGERPRVRGLRARWPVWMLRGLVAAAVVVCLALWADTAINAVEDHFAHPVSIHPRSVSASHSDPGHPPSTLHDGYNNTWWGDGVSGAGVGQYVTVDFGRPIHLLDVVITPGAGVEQDVYFKEARPLAIDVTLFHANNTTSVEHITLDDTPGPQTFAIRGSDIDKLQLTLRSAYGASSKTEIAIAELEFFGRSNAGATGGTTG